ncbi:MAG: nucleoside recognition domain-containing protein, partial [Clostridia bacterium]|nr:nucleoside recognition domain-containing protein [Clostridia bacterium]
GFVTAVRIIPYLVGMMTAISVFRASGAMELCARLLAPVLQPLGIPAEVLPLALMRPLSGGAALGVAADLIRTYGPDSFLGRLASVMQGSTDTTFYVLSVYFGSVGITRYRYAVALGLTADVVSFLAAVVICRQVFA